MSPELDELIRLSKLYVSLLSPLEKEEMLRQQAEGWARSEAQWAKDFREGKCKRD